MLREDFEDMIKELDKEIKKTPFHFEIRISEAINIFKEEEFHFFTDALRDTGFSFLLIHDERENGVTLEFKNHHILHWNEYYYKEVKRVYEWFKTQINAHEKKDKTRRLQSLFEDISLFQDWAKEELLDVEKRHFPKKKR